MSERQQELLAAISEAYAAGWKLVPCVQHSKSEAWDCIFKDAQLVQGWKADGYAPSIEEMRGWVEKDPTINLAVKCGKASGIVIIDVDHPAEIPTMIRGLLEVHTTRVVETWRGYHVYFKLPEAWGETPFKSRKGQGFDVLCEGYYALIPPSQVRTYDERGPEFSEYRSNGLDVAEMPGELRKYLEALPEDEPFSYFEEDEEDFDEDEEDFDEGFEYFDDDEADELTANEYQEAAKLTAVYPGQGTLNGLLYTSLALGGEAGELQNQAKKILRDDGGVITPERKAKMLKELGDVQWYVAAVAWELGITLEDLMLGNLGKLQQREEAPKLVDDGGAGELPF